MKRPRLAANGSDWPPSDPASSATKNNLQGPPIRIIIAARVDTRIAVALSAGLTIAGKGSVRVGNQSRHFLCSCCSCSSITNKSTPLMPRWIGILSKENCSVGSASVREINVISDLTFPRTPAGHPLHRNQEGINSADAGARRLENSLTWSPTVRDHESKNDTSTFSITEE